MILYWLITKSIAYNSVWYVLAPYTFGSLAKPFVREL